MLQVIRNQAASWVVKLLFVMLILCCLLIGGVIKKYKIKALPESGASMIFGFICGAFLNLSASHTHNHSRVRASFFSC